MDRDCQDIINIEFCFILLRLVSKANAKMLMMYFCLVTVFLYFIYSEYIHPASTNLLELLIFLMGRDK